MKKNETKQIRALGRMVAEEITNEEMEKITGSICLTRIVGGSSCFVGGVDVADASP